VDADIIRQEVVCEQDIHIVSDSHCIDDILITKGNELLPKGSGKISCSHLNQLTRPSVIEWKFPDVMTTQADILNRSI